MSAQRRTNQEWLEALSGILGSSQQDDALHDLANYLYIVSSNHLERKRGMVSRLWSLSDDDLAALTQEFVQEYMEKMVKDDFALLAKFSGHGHFLSWSAQVVINLCNSELRRIPWRRTKRLDAPELQIADHCLQPDEIILRNQIGSIVATCLDNLPERYRFALVQCVVEGQSASEVGELLETTANAVHLLVFRAKKKMKKYLEQEGIEPELLGLM